MYIFFIDIGVTFFTMSNARSQIVNCTDIYNVQTFTGQTNELVQLLLLLLLYTKELYAVIVVAADM